MSDPIPISWRRRSLSSEHSARITLARRTDGCDVCAGLGRPRTTTGRPCVYCGAPVDDLLLVVDSTQDRRRLYAVGASAEELPASTDFEEVAVGDLHASADDLLAIGLCLDQDTPDGWEIERLWGEP